MTTLRRDEDRRDVDALPGDEVKSYPPTYEVGRTGLKRVSGYVEEEFLPQLRGRKAVQIYREMSDNSPVIGAFLLAVERLVRQIEWRVEPASSKAEDKANAEFVEQCMEDMSHSWGDMLTEIMSMCTYGWEWSEIVYKKRIGPWETDATRKSKFTDGRFGWRKISTRSQETLLRWAFDEDGGIQAMVQMPPPDYQKKIIPIERSLLFRITAAKNNPESKSLLRNAYSSWFFLKRFQEIEAVGVERDLTGVPVAKIPSRLFNAPPGSKEAKEFEAWKKMVTSVRRNEQDGLVIPWDIDPDTKQPTHDFALLTSGGTRQFDVRTIINDYKTEMLMSVLADFMMVGHEDNGGSYALHTDKTGMFRTSLNSIAQSIADVFNRHAIPRLFAINAIKPAELPRIVPNDVDPPDLTQLSGFMTAMTSAGIQWFPDPELEKFLRDAARLPQLDEDVEKVREVEQRQAMIISLAQKKLEAIQVETQAQQGEMAMEQMAQGVDPNAPAGAAGPAPDPGDPDGKHAAAQAGESTNQAKIGTATSKVKLEQEKAKLTNLKKPAPKAPPNKPIKKSLSAFGVDHEIAKAMRWGDGKDALDATRAGIRAAVTTASRVKMRPITVVRTPRKDRP